MPRSLAVSAFMLGFTSLLLQVVLTRELLTSFLGNEISVAIVLLVWLVFVALGAGPLSRWLVPRERDAAVGSRFVRSIAVSSLFAVLVADIGCQTGSLPGQAVGPLQMLGWSALALGVLCVTLGALFTTLCRAAEAETGEDRSAAVYAWEAGGAVVAGLGFHFVLAERLSALAVVLLAIGLNAGVGTGALITRHRWDAGAVLGVLAAGCIVVSLLPRNMLSGLRWLGSNLVAEADSRYGNLAVVERNGQVVVYQSGLPAFSTEDTEANEIAVHPALLAHPEPKRVLVIGGGLGGALQEVLKHPGLLVDYVEIDRKLVELAGQHLPPELQRPLRNPRVHVHLADGRRFVRASRERYDVVLVLTPDPATTALGRYYTCEFFGEVRSILAPGGLLCIGLSAAQAQLTGPRLELHASVFRALQAVFPTVNVIPGERTQYLASGGALTLEPDVLSQRLQERGLQTAFVNATWLRFQAGSFPRQRLLDSLASARNVPPNRDAVPLAAHFWLRTWLREMAPGAAGWFGAIRLFYAALVALMALGVAASLVVRAERVLAVGASFGVAVAGFVTMGAQLCLVIAYQATVGYLYHRLGLLSALFMFGLAIGAASARRVSGPIWGLTIALLALAASTIALPRLFGAGVLTDAGADVAFASASAWFGFLGGAVFPLGLAVGARDSVSAGRAAGRLYAADLTGAALAAVLVGAILIPAVGIPGTVPVLTAAALAAGLGACVACLRRRGGRGVPSGEPPSALL